MARLEGGRSSSSALSRFIAAMISPREAEELCWRKAIQIFNNDLTRKKEKRIATEISNGAQHEFHGLVELRQVAEKAIAECCTPHRPAFERLGKALVAIDHYAPVVDVMIQQQPFVVNLVWGGIRFIIAASARASQAGASIACSLRKLILAVPRYQSELRTHWLSTTVSEATSLALAHLLCYIRNAECFLVSSLFKRSAKAAFSHKLEHILLDLNEAEQALDRTIRATQGQAQADFFRKTGAESARQGLLLSNNEESVSQVDAKLSVIDEKIKVLPQMLRDDTALDRIFPHCLTWLERGLSQNSSSSSPRAGTCEWILASPRYREWAESGFQHVLWIEGQRKCGKTTCVKYLAQRDTAEVVISYYFQDACHRDATTPSRFAATLLLKLLRNRALFQHEQLASTIVQLLLLSRLSDCGLESHPAKLLDILEQLFALLSSFTLVVDNLIEPDINSAGEECSIISFLRKLSSKRNSRIVISSRTGALLDTIFKGAYRVVITPEIVRNELILYLDNEIRLNKEDNPGLFELKADIFEVITSRAHDPFTWARFIMKELKNATTRNDMHARLRELPLEIMEFYRQEMRIGSQELRKGDKARRRDALLLVSGTFVKWSLDDLVHFLAFDTTANIPREDDMLTSPVSQISKLCHPFLFVDNDVVDFVDDSARSAVEESDPGAQESNALLAKKCLSKLLEDPKMRWNYSARLLQKNLRAGEVVQSSDQSPKTKVTYEYACLNLVKYVTAIDNPSDELLSMLSKFLVNNAFVAWSETLFQLKPNSGIGAHVQIRSSLEQWLERLPRDVRDRVPINDFFVKAHDRLREDFDKESGDKILPYLPLIRLGEYFNVGGRNSQDHVKAYEYKMKVAAGFIEVLGPRNRLTLRARTQVFKEFLYQKRFNDAARGLADIVEDQRVVIGTDDIDFYFTLQLLGSVQVCQAFFELSIVTLNEAASGFRQLEGDEYFYTLQTEFFIGIATERTPRLGEAQQIYEELLEIFLPLGGPTHPFSLMLKTGLGSVLRKLGNFKEAEKVLVESFEARKALFTKEDVVTIDSALQVAALCYEDDHGDDGLEYLDFVAGTKIVDIEFERRCQEQHLRALFAFAAGSFAVPIAALRQLLDSVSGKRREKNNRELLGARLTLADALRQQGSDEYDVLLVFAEIVVLIPEDLASSHELEDGASACSLVDEPEPADQLRAAERALRLVRVALPDEAESFLKERGLKWRRKADFWALAGGPITDTALISGLEPSDYQIFEPTLHAAM